MHAEVTNMQFSGIHIYAILNSAGTNSLSAGSCISIQQGCRLGSWGAVVGSGGAGMQAWAAGVKTQASGVQTLG